MEDIQQNLFAQSTYLARSHQGSIYLGDGNEGVPHVTDNDSLL